jgi:hypothetical protein
MKHHAFSSRATAALAGMTILLIGGTSTGALAAVTSASAPSAQQDTPTATDAPAGLAARGGDTSATLSWSAPSSGGSSTLKGYDIYGGPSGFRLSLMQHDASSPATITGLTNGTTYTFRVIADDGFRDAPSATATATPEPAGSVPQAPTGLKPSSGDGYIALSWNPAVVRSGSAVTSYRVYAGFSSGRVGAQQYTTTQTAIRIPGLENGTTYYLRVEAINNAGEGPWSEYVSATPVKTVTVVPPRPTGLTARASHGAVVLAWSPPKGGLAPGEDYTVYVGTRSGSETALSRRVHGTSASITRLTNGTRYYFEVALVAGGQTSKRSAEASAVPKPSSGSGYGPGGGSQPSPGNSNNSDNSNNSNKSGIGVVPPSSPSAPPDGGVIQDSSSSGLSTGLIVLLAALVLAASAGVTAAIMWFRRRPYGPRRGSVPAPRRPQDDRPAGPAGEPMERFEEMNGPRHR